MALIDILEGFWKLDEDPDEDALDANGSSELAHWDGGLSRFPPISYR